MSLFTSRSDRDIAVMDVGSNSVRLVLFRLEGRALWPIFNEKVSAGLGRGMSKTGRLSEEGVESAARAMKRFAALLDARKVKERYAVATAAVRAAEDGPAFVERVREESGISIDVITGEEEARLSALGVLAGIPDADGVAGDLGGSSVELTPVSNRQAADGISLPLGPLALPDGLDTDRKTMKSFVDEGLDESIAMLREQGKTLYAVGGAWRALAHLAMETLDHPLRVLHQYELNQKDAAKIADFAASTSSASMSGVQGVSGKRAEQLAYAGLLLKRLMKLGKFKRVVFSAYGLREGVVFDHLSKQLQADDPLIAGAEALASPAAPAPDFGRALGEWLEPVFAAKSEILGERGPLVRSAACRLADLGARFHPDHKANLSRELVLYAPFAGVAHAERAFLALAIHHRYSGKKPPADTRIFDALLSEDQRAGAIALGLGMRLGAALSGRSEDLLSRFALTVENGSLRLETPARERELVIERAASRFEQFAEAVDRKPEIAETG